MPAEQACHIVLTAPLDAWVDKLVAPVDYTSASEARPAAEQSTGVERV